MKRNSKFLFFWMYVALLLGTGISYAESAEPADENAHGEKSVDNDDSFKLSSLWLWPFEHVIQPALNGLIFPIAKPIDYAVKNGIVEKSLELISIGDDYKIMVYPSFNFKPGSETMIGANYRHRGIFLEKDYLVLQTVTWALPHAIPSTPFLEVAFLEASATISIWTGTLV